MPRFTDGRRKCGEQGATAGVFPDLPKFRRQVMANPTTRNEGEGNRTADRNYREATREFVESERGQEEIRKAGRVDPNAEKDIRAAEERAKSRAKEHDPAETKNPSKPA
jgi:hypothetical protein